MVFGVGIPILSTTKLSGAQRRGEDQTAFLFGFASASLAVSRVWGVVGFVALVSSSVVAGKLELGPRSEGRLQYPLAGTGRRARKISDGENELYPS